MDYNTAVMANDLLLIDRQAIAAELRRAFDEPTTQVMLGVLERVAAQVHAAGVTREDFAELKAIVARIEAVQERTTLGLEELRQTVAELTRGQAELRESVVELRQTVAELAQGQAELRQSVDRLAKQVGGLSDNFGAELEDTAYIVLYDLLRREFGWNVQPLERSWQIWNGAEEEIDIFGTAIDPAKPEETIWIVGEAKHNLTLKQVERFVDTVKRAREHLSGRIFAVCFCYRARPEVVQAVKLAGLRLVYSYGRMI
ncbi:MAG: hypothetical protein HY741_16975 [Chloroflexi bacterium]|nr:hypothetical protein [Chloroflexota bacterium]